MTNELEKYVQSYFGAPETELQRITAFFQPKSLKKNEYFLKADGRSDQLGFVQSGIIREFLYDDGKEVTKWLSTPGYFVVDLASFLCFMVLEERVVTHLSRSAEERYDQFFQFAPELFNQVPEGSFA